VVLEAVAVQAQVPAGRAEPSHRFESENAGLRARVFLTMHFAARRVTSAVSVARVFARMVIPALFLFSGAWRPGGRASAPIALLAIALCGCSFDLGSWSSAPEKEAPPKAAATAATAAGDAHGHLTRAQALAKSGKTEDALAEFDKAITIDPHHAEALYNRGLLHQRERQHQLAVDDFTSANGLTPQRAEPLLARAISYLAMDKPKEAAADLDEAVQADPQSAQSWTTRGLAYERLGDKDKAKASYGRALAIRPKDEAARSGLARVGG